MRKGKCASEGARPLGFDAVPICWPTKKGSLKMSAACRTPAHLTGTPAPLIDSRRVLLPACIFWTLFSRVPAGEQADGFRQGNRRETKKDAGRAEKYPANGTGRRGDGSNRQAFRRIFNECARPPVYRRRTSDVSFRREGGRGRVVGLRLTKQSKLSSPGGATGRDRCGCLRGLKPGVRRPPHGSRIVNESARLWGGR